MPHLFTDISSHGFGHLAQTAPVLNELVERMPGLDLTIRCGLPLETLRSRIRTPFRHMKQSSDFGFIMHDAVCIDRVATAAAYRAWHENWNRRVEAEADLLHDLSPDLVLTDVAYLPLAGAAQCNVPALSMCSLNWADIFAHVFGQEPWAKAIYEQMLASYRSAGHFLRLTPAMPMPDLPNARPIAPVAALGKDRRTELQERIGVSWQERIVLVAFGGYNKELNAGRWPVIPGVHWLIPKSWSIARDDMTTFESLLMHFSDLVRSVDAVLTKPGYGTFTEAACNGTAVLYLRRDDDWPEQDCLIEWLEENARCREVDLAALQEGKAEAALQDLWRQKAPPVQKPSGSAEAAGLITSLLSAPY